MIVYHLTHIRRSPEHLDSDTFDLGIYSSREKAEAAIALLRTKPGFVDFPDDFCIDRELVDQIQWEEGFSNDPAE